MQTTWLHHDNRPNLILFFGGWGSDPKPFAPLASQLYDVLMCYDYRRPDVSFDIDELLGQYRQVSLVGWSLGVWMANELCQSWAGRFKHAIAVNGTLHPIDDKRGIPLDVFNGTLQNLSVFNLIKFNRRMVTKPEHRRLFEQNAPSRSIDDLAEELAMFLNLSQNTPNRLFDAALISTNDLIFTADNQRCAWEQVVPTQELESGHFPFYDFPSWDGFMEAATSQKSNSRNQ